MNWFAQFNGHVQIEEWHLRDTQIFLSQLEQLDRAATTLNRTFASLRRFASWVREQLSSPFRHVLPSRGIKEIAGEDELGQQPALFLSSQSKAFLRM
ncbi:MAG: hypothetical protein I8H75_05850 [Myxococcaceae bacterium]|nr:hypothetical protein [Myxococcaceae bacterium]